MKYLKSIVVVTFLVGLGFVMSCDTIDEIKACVSEFAEYEDKAREYEGLTGGVCDNKDKAQEFITFLETEAKGSCIEEQLDKNGEDLDQIIADAKAELAACPS